MIASEPHRIIGLVNRFRSAVSQVCEFFSHHTTAADAARNALSPRHELGRTAVSFDGCAANAGPEGEVHYAASESVSSFVAAIFFLWVFWL